MSGSFPRGPGVITLNDISEYEGCIEAPYAGVNGKINLHVPPTGVDNDGCPSGGSVPTPDELNGYALGLACIITQGWEKPLPNQRLCDDPCMAWNAITDYVINFTCEGYDETVCERLANIEQAVATLNPCEADVIQQDQADYMLGIQETSEGCEIKRVQSAVSGFLPVGKTTANSGGAPGGSDTTSPAPAGSVYYIAHFQRGTPGGYSYTVTSALASQGHTITVNTEGTDEDPIPVSVEVLYFGTL